MTAGTVPERFGRIVCVPGVRSGDPCVRDTGITVFEIVGMNEVITADQLVAAYPNLEHADVEEARAFVGWLATMSDDEIRRAFPSIEAPDITAIRDFAEWSS